MWYIFDFSIFPYFPIILECLASLPYMISHQMQLLSSYLRKLHDEYSDPILDDTISAFISHYIWYRYRSVNYSTCCITYMYLVNNIASILNFLEVSRNGTDSNKL